MRFYLFTPIRFVCATLLVAVLIATTMLFSTHSVQVAQASETTTISVDNTNVSAGTPINVTGQGFDRNDYIDFYLDNLDGESFTSGFSESDGSFVSEVYLPSGVVQGPHTLFARDDEANVAQIVLNFKPRVAPTVGKPGMSAQFTGGSFTANETVTIYWGTSSSGQQMGTATSTEGGDLSFSFTLPEGLVDGKYPVTVVRTNQKPVKVTTSLKIIPVQVINSPGIRFGKQPVKVKVTGFMPWESVEISWSANGGQSLGYVYVNEKGTGSTNSDNEIWPPSAPPGTYTLTARGDSGLEAISTLSIGPGIRARMDTSFVPGAPLTVTGGGFTPGEIIQVYFQTPQNGTATATADSAGGFTVTLNTPYVTDRAAEYVVYAKSTTGVERARTKFTFSTPSFYADGDAYYDQWISLTGYSLVYQEEFDIVWGYQQPGQKTVTTAHTDGNGDLFVVQRVPSFEGQGPLTIAAIGKVSKLVFTVTVNNYAAVNLSPVKIDGYAHANAGDEITVKGGSFGANHPINIAWRGTTIATVTSDSEGTFTTKIIVPEVVGAGDVAVTATDTTTNVSGSTTFYYVPTLTVNPSAARNGDVLTITGEHFPSQTLILIYAVSDFSSVTTDDNGSFTVTVTLSGADSSHFRVSAFGYYNDEIRAGFNLTILQ